MSLEEAFQKETGCDIGRSGAINYYKRYIDWLELVVKQLKDSIEIPWTPFYFEGNLAWGWIHSAEEWERIKKSYGDSGIDLSSANRNPNNEKDAFGFYHEYTSSDTLGDFAKLHDMDLS